MNKAKDLKEEYRIMNARMRITAQEMLRAEGNPDKIAWVRQQLNKNRVTSIRKIIASKGLAVTYLDETSIKPKRTKWAIAMAYPRAVIDFIRSRHLNQKMDFLRDLNRKLPAAYTYCPQYAPADDEEEDQCRLVIDTEMDQEAMDASEQEERARDEERTSTI